MANENETVSLVQDSHSDYVCYQVQKGDDDFYLCDADGDKVQLKEWFLLKELGTIPAESSDAFFELIAATAKRIED